jgi:hypothetical protein
LRNFFPGSIKEGGYLSGPNAIWLLCLSLYRYGSPIVVLDLVKQSEKREREVIVGDEYRHAVDYLNSSITNAAHQIRYCALDYSHISKHRNLNISTSLNEVATWAVNQTGKQYLHPWFGHAKIPFF